ncbi:MAG: hypothetical protein KAX40_03050, partial [Herpetosiphon sp.]|nr:hypothetical protein [Herpetosiphon sp.]
IHGSKPIHIQQHQAWIEEQIKKQVRNGADAWQQKEELFANLEFCASVAEQLKQLHATDLNWNHVLKHLWELQRYANQWKVGAFDPDAIQLNLSVESSATLSQYKAERTFLCPNGEVRLFSWHTKIKFSGWRIYFVPEPQNHQLIIGYIGKHLPTAKFK